MGKVLNLCWLWNRLFNAAYSLKAITISKFYSFNNSSKCAFNTPPTHRYTLNSTKNVNRKLAEVWLNWLYFNWKYFNQFVWAIWNLSTMNRIWAHSPPARTEKGAARGRTFVFSLKDIKFVHFTAIFWSVGLFVCVFGRMINGMAECVCVLCLHARKGAHFSINIFGSNDFLSIED